ncbi:hypothetical protein FHS59_000688 [Algoriphagus iocasae]|uniref:DUF547 domain-containing protein n=1 Tax=Algoriphagus iocasae TaxID=1836499 RepID=A0A841ME78_9BACT|nr:DUF547 domain-containing protein [Algoriphagus iocasae]MBB6325073.1 hypothetical protein [Algoriphagus iocasae]
MKKKELMNHMKTSLLAGLAIFFLSCQNSNSEVKENTVAEKVELGNNTKAENGPNHTPWDELLKKHVDASGMVDYEGFVKDKAKLEAYLKTLSSKKPDKSWSREEQLAYWINAYNAFTVKLIVDNYPTKSIKDLGPALKIPLVSDVWHYKFFQIEGEDFNLDEIEHGILRKDFDEPRIHFAVNCASISCPPLLNEAFVPSKLESQLNSQAEAFINGGTRNKISKNSVQLSSIFSWFKGDFTDNGTLIDFLNKYSKVKIDQNAKISYLDYDWNLNKQ